MPSRKSQLGMSSAAIIQQPDPDRARLRAQKTQSTESINLSGVRFAKSGFAVGKCRGTGVSSSESRSAVLAIVSSTQI
jgi:hypothetical protein